MIAGKVKKDLLKGIHHYAKVYVACPCRTQISVTIGVEDRGDEGQFAVPKYHILKEYKRMEEVTVNDVRQVKMDLIGAGNMVSNFILNKLVQLAEEMGVDYTEISAMILAVQGPDDDENEYGEILIWIYNGKNPVKKMTIEDLLS